MFIETQHFRLPPDTTEDAFREDDARLQEELMLNAPGLLRRTTAKSDDGEWITITLWRSAEDATGARPYATVRGYTDLGG